MEAKKAETRTQAFVLTPTELERIYSLFPTNSEIRLEITCRDKIERKYQSLEEFLLFEHPPDKQISELFIHEFSETYKNSTTIHFKDSESPAASIILICKGDEEYVARIITKLEDRFSSIKPWYNWLAKTGWIFVILLANVPLLIQLTQDSTSALTPSKLKSELANTAFPRIIAGILILIILLGVGLWIYRLVERLWRFIFPMGVFAIGQGVKRHEHRDLLRTCVVIGFVINVIAGIVLWLVM